MLLYKLMMGRLRNHMYNVIAQVKTRCNHNTIFEIEDCLKHSKHTQLHLQFCVFFINLYENKHTLNWKGTSVMQFVVLQFASCHLYNIIITMLISD